MWSNNAHLCDLRKRIYVSYKSAFLWATMRFIKKLPILLKYREFF